MTDHAGHFRVCKLLGHSSALLGISAVILGHQLEGDFFATDGHACGVQLFYGHDGAVFIVFAQMGNGATGGAYVSDGHHGILGHGKTA